MFFDSHCHLDMMVLPQCDRERLLSDCFGALDQIVTDIRRAGIIGMINIGVDVASSKNSIALAQRYNDVFATVGIHPCDCGDAWRDDFATLVTLLDQKKEHRIVGIGETGLDFFHQPFDSKRQNEAFRAHIELALQHDLPIIIHARSASDETLSVLQEYRNDGLRGVMHCFTHAAYVADKVLELGLHIGIGAYITYPKNNELRAIVSNIPLERLLLETDAPFLPPQQYRGKQNTPAYIPLFASVIAALKNISCEDLAAATASNAQQLFALSSLS